MKLITEVNLQDIKYLQEGEDGKKSHFIEGVFMMAEIKNRNGRMYPLKTLANEVSRYNREYIEKNRAYGELGHPAGPTINLDRVSHMIKELKQDGNNIVGKAKIMDTPMGNIVKNLMDEGAQLGVSSRGMGTLKSDRSGIQVVQDDFQLSTAADIVADPSAPEAFVRGVMENVEWLNIDGQWVPQFLEQTQKEIKSASKSDLAEAKTRAFVNFMRHLGS